MREVESYRHGLLDLRRDDEGRTRWTPAIRPACRSVLGASDLDSGRAQARAGRLIRKAWAVPIAPRHRVRTATASTAATKAMVPAEVKAAAKPPSVASASVAPSLGPFDERAERTHLVPGLGDDRERLHVSE
ncbi:hypothetical protein [Amnibacterium sp.]|uniref:hypothetical protein n=1 Tax=Amnibacterium sp. TaxID=1872496 RepID=UPI00260C14F0|nr:hypothetical protein [Amnibacterium sp.]